MMLQVGDEKGGGLHVRSVKGADIAIDLMPGTILFDLFFYCLHRVITLHLIIVGDCFLLNSSTFHYVHTFSRERARLTINFFF
jgi:hypothetical protein